VNLTHLGKSDRLATRPIPWLDPVPVDPVRRIGIPTNLQIFAELLVADGATLG
jgi:hypothetical protein